MRRPDRRFVRAAVAVVALAIAVIVTVPRLPRTADGSGTLDECSFGSAVLVLDDEWGTVFAGYEGAPYYSLPVLSWPPGMDYDERTGQLRAADGEVLFRRGDRVHVTGSVVHVDGDIPLCFFTLQLRIDAIEPG